MSKGTIRLQRYDVINRKTHYHSFTIAEVLAATGYAADKTYAMLSSLGGILHEQHIYAVEATDPNVQSIIRKFIVTNNKQPTIYLNKQQQTLACFKTHESVVKFLHVTAETKTSDFKEQFKRDLDIDVYPLDQYIGIDRYSEMYVLSDKNYMLYPSHGHFGGKFLLYSPDKQYMACFTNIGRLHDHINVINNQLKCTGWEHGETMVTSTGYFIRYHDTCDVAPPYLTDVKRRGLVGYLNDSPKPSMIITRHHKDTHVISEVSISQEEAANVSSGGISSALSKGILYKGYYFENPTVYTKEIDVLLALRYPKNINNIRRRYASQLPKEYLDTLPKEN